MVRLGTKWPSMTSMCSQSASAVTSPTASARPPKSADSTEGAICSIRGEPTGVPAHASPSISPASSRARRGASRGRHGTLARRLDLDEEPEHAVAAYGPSCPRSTRLGADAVPGSVSPTSQSGRPRRRARADASPRKVVQARSSRTTRSSCDGRARPVEPELLGLELRRVGRLALAAACPRPGRRPPPARMSHEQLGPDVGQAGPSEPRRVRRSPIDGAGAVASTGPVSSPASSRMTHTPVLGVAGQDGPLHRRRPPPAGQQREVHVDHGDDVEDALPGRCGRRPRPRQLGAQRRDVVEAVVTGEPEIEGGLLDRAGRDARAPAPAGVGPAHHQGDVVAGGDQGLERRRPRRRVIQGRRAGPRRSSTDRDAADVAA